MDILNTREVETSKLLPEIVIRPQTPDEEYDRISLYLHKLQWYTDNGYKLYLPSHPKFNALAQPGADLSLLDSEDMRMLFAEELYEPSAYAEGLQSVEADLRVLEQAFSVFQTLHSLWGFRLMPRYEIVLTRYGTLCSYDKLNGRIIISTMQRLSTLRIVIHECVHIGIEEDIIQRFRLSHWEKERIVDLICQLLFRHLLPDYTIDERGDSRVDPYVTLKLYTTYLWQFLGM